jgi:chemotaxis protein methyltransferase CheR
MGHRVSNNLQIVAGVLLAKARLASSEEARAALVDAHRRVLSVATIQEHLDLSASPQSIDMSRYLSRLCSTIACSMVGQERPVALTVDADSHALSPRDAVNIGLIVTELVMNALKHAFPAPKTGAAILVFYGATDDIWRLTVSDNGAGMNGRPANDLNRSLGTRLVDQLAKQLKAHVLTSSGREGTTVSVKQSLHAI